MFNPFVRFIPELIDAFRKHGEHLIVSQTFRSGMNVFTEDKVALMFCQYSDWNYAQVHLQAVKADKYAAIIDLEKEKHRNKVMEMLQPDSGYLVFSNLIRDQRSVEEFADRHYAAKLKRYLERNTAWRMSTTSLRPRLQLIFGELFVVVKFQSQQLRVKFADIENY